MLLLSLSTLSQSIEINGDARVKDSLKVDFIVPDDSSTIDIQGYPAWSDTTNVLVTVSDTTVTSAYIATKLNISDTTSFSNQFALKLAKADTNYTDSTDVKGWNFMNEDSAMYATQTDLASYLALADTNYTDSTDVKGWNYMNEDSTLYATQTDILPQKVVVYNAAKGGFSTNQWPTLDGVLTIDLQHGWCAYTSGEIIGISWFGDCTTHSGNRTLYVQALAGGSWKGDTDGTLITGTGYFTESHAFTGKTFNAEDVLSMQIVLSGGTPGTVTMRNIVVSLIVQYD